MTFYKSFATSPLTAKLGTGDAVAAKTFSLEKPASLLAGFKLIGSAEIGADKTYSTGRYDWDHERGAFTWAFTGTDLSETFIGRTHGFNVVNAHGGNDLLLGGVFSDHLYCGDGDDRAEGGAGGDRISGGAGEDTLLGGDGDDHLYGDAGDDALYGDAGDDALFGGAGRDALHGGAGDDTIRGYDVNEMFGGDGDDVLIGGGSTQMWGDAGADVFRFVSLGNSIQSAGRALIWDYAPGEDRIELDLTGERNFSLTHIPEGAVIEWDMHDADGRFVAHERIQVVGATPETLSIDDIFFI